MQVSLQGKAGQLALALLIFLNDLITLHWGGRGVLLIPLFSKAFIAGDIWNYGAESRILMHKYLPLNLSQKTIASQQRSMLCYKAQIDPSKAEFGFLRTQMQDGWKSNKG